MLLSSKSTLVCASLLAFSTLTACAPKIGGNDYSIRDVGAINQVSYGTIVAARPIAVQGKRLEEQGKLGAGAIIGGGAGALIGSQVGHGATPAIVGALGALAGGVAGHMIENQATSQQGMEYEIQMESGGSISITQGLEPMLSVGQRVKVISSARERSRVVPA